MRKPHLRGRGPDLPVLDQVVQYDIQPGYVVFTLPAPKRLRVLAGGVTVADTIEGLILLESDHLPIYYFPIHSVRMDLFEGSERQSHCPYKGEAEYYSLKGKSGAYDDIMWRYAKPIPGCPPIGDYVSFYWHEVDHWFEEDEEVFVHARDPYRRIDCLPSSRRVQVVLNGLEVADSRSGVFLFETGLPTRYYLPPEDVRTDLLQPSGTTSQCPYKGQAGYKRITVAGKTHEDIVWYYPDPVREADRIKGLLCFANEFVDRILIDGVEQPRPVTSFSHGYNYHGTKASAE
ncbi:DUF427 domain-containing protein [Pelagibius sp. Alg239-R121]|uniref:DUF427 domain-containing protein n=1 Tax=Pelagibius sp. Alg239-R121 TaxID=2993448 RepID=UPI0024A64E06|nr:DUF427 domain-containing protein [Pelagibius sp. Alg239-R121]